MHLILGCGEFLMMGIEQILVIIFYFDMNSLKLLGFDWFYFKVNCKMSENNQPKLALIL